MSCSSFDLRGVRPPKTVTSLGTPLTPTTRLSGVPLNRSLFLIFYTIIDLELTLINVFRIFVVLQGEYECMNCCILNTLTPNIHQCN